VPATNVGGGIDRYELRMARSPGSRAPLAAVMDPGEFFHW